MTEWLKSTIRFLRRNRRLLIISASSTVVGTLIAGMVLLPLQHAYLRDGPSATGNTLSSLWKIDPTVTVTPVNRMSRFVLLAPRRYYKLFRIDIYGGDIGFPPNTSLQITASAGKIFQLWGPESIKPTLANGDSAVDWKDKKYRSSTKTVFIFGPNPGIQAKILVVIMVEGKDVPDDDITLIVSPPGYKPVGVEYVTVKWPLNK